jgi:hypothetical protein
MVDTLSATELHILKRSKWKVLLCLPQEGEGTLLSSLPDSPTKRRKRCGALELLHVTDTHWSTCCHGGLGQAASMAQGSPLLGRSRDGTVPAELEHRGRGSPPYSPSHSWLRKLALVS